MLVAAALEGLYRWGGHRLVDREYTHPSGPFLYNLIPAAGPHALGEYLARADVVWRTLQLSWIAVALILIAAPALDRATGRVHDVCLRAGRFCAAHTALFLSLGAASVFAVTALIARFVLLTFPNSGDEYCYLYQAQTFLAGRVANTPHALQQFFVTNHLISRDGRLFSVFPPGWPVLLAASMRLGLAAWLLNPLISAALFVLTFLLARRLTRDPGTACLAAITLVWSSYFLLTGASYFSHTACACLVVAAMLMMLRMADGGGAASAVIAGVLTGFALITRYYTPALCLLPLSLALWRERRWRPEYLWAAAGTAIPILGLLAYNHALTGSALVLSKEGVDRYDQLWFARGTWHRGAEFMLAHVWDFVLWTPPVLFVVYVASLRRFSIASRLDAASAGFACLMLGLYPYINRGGNQYGPRFYFDALPLLAIGAAAWLFGEPYESRSRRARRTIYLLLVAAAAHLPIGAMQIATAHQEVIERLDLSAEASRAHLDHAIVFVTTPVGAINPLPQEDMTRNGIDFDDAVLYALDLGAENHTLRAFYRDRSCYRYRYDAVERAGSLTPCEPDR